MKLLVSMFVLLISGVSFAAGIPKTQSDIVKLVVFENGDKVINHEFLGSISIFDWFSSNLSSENNQDLNENGEVWFKLQTKCEDKEKNVRCSVAIVGHEFVYSKDTDTYCVGYDSASRIQVDFTKENDQLVYAGVMIDADLSGDGPCGKDWL